jgi:hypothetical protein
MAKLLELMLVITTVASKIDLIISLEGIDPHIAEPSK